MKRERFDRLSRPAQARGLDRRATLRRLVLGAAALPLAKLAMACGGDDDADRSVDAAPGADGGISGGWASGGTAAMTDKASYPDPFTTAATSCVLVASTTDGPCTTTSELVREDISEAGRGIPVRLALKFVDASCAPVAGATVKIWHTNHEGVYSGDTPNPSLCSSNDAAAIAQNFMRGVQTTAADGTVFFDTCFPGWYSGRAVHIHFQVTNGATAYRVSQLFFPEDVTRGIFASAADYAAFGQPNTTFANDNIIAPITGEARARLVLDVAKMTDGAMLASKVVTVTT